MRIKTQHRREAIIQAAIAVFNEAGFERASMSEIAARLGGSKATLYGYFASKEDLYVAAMQEAIAAQAGEISRILDPQKCDIAAVLQAFAIAYLEKVTSPDILANKRTMIGQGGASSVAAQLYDHVERYVWTPMAAYLARLMERGDLRRLDPRIAAYHLQGLLAAGLIEPSLHGVTPRLSIAEAAPLAVDAFLRIYGSANATR